MVIIMMLMMKITNHLWISTDIVYDDDDGTWMVMGDCYVFLVMDDW